MYVAEGLKATQSTGLGFALYAADNVKVHPVDTDEWAFWRWQRPYLPSRFMPRRCARQILLVGGVGAMHVQDVTDEQAIAEGIERGLRGYKDYRAQMRNAPPNQTARSSFYTLWDSIHRKPPHDWASNPWVWRLYDLKEVARR